MKLLLSWLRRVYAWGMRLYPVKFRDAFREEMTEIFGLRAAEELSGGWEKLVVLCLQEFWGLFISLVQEHWANKELMMKIVFSNDFGRIGMWGALSFGAAFALIKGLSFAGFHGSAILYILGGFLGGFVFGLAVDDRKHIKWMALSGALAFGGGHFIAAFVVNSFVHLISTESLLIIVVPIIEPVLIGALLGIGIGFIEQNWTLGGRLGMVSALGFGLGQITGFLVSLPFWGLAQAIGSYQPPLNSQLSPWVGTVGMLLVGVVVYVVAGIVGGAILGRTIERLGT